MDAAAIKEHGKRMLALDLKDAERIIADPKYRDAVIKFNQLIVKEIIEQKKECEWAVITANRWRRIANVKWEFKPGAPDPAKVIVTATVNKISLVPDPDPLKLIFRRIVEMRGNGHFAIEMDEGESYFFYLKFQHENFSLTKTEGYLCSAGFQMAAPLSKGTQVDNQPSGKIREEIRAFVDAQDVFDDEYRCAIERIKEKGLSPEDTERRMQDVREYVERVKDKLGM